MLIKNMDIASIVIVTSSRNESLEIYADYDSNIQECVVKVVDRKNM